MYTLAIRIAKWTLIVLVILLIGGVGGVLIERWALPRLTASDTFKNWSFLKKANETTTIINNTEQLVIREDDSIEKISSQAASSVVNVISVQKKAIVGQGNTLSNAVSDQTRPITAAGVIVTNDGLVATYRSAILEHNAEYAVLLSNGATYKATLAGIDPLTNIAFLQIDATGLSSIALANSDDMRPGKKLILMANSTEEYRNRFSLSLLSNINKSFNLSEKTVASSEKWEGVFEVDASHMEAYLGGPAINFGGEMVGLVGNVHLDNQTAYFLLPVNTVRRSLDRFLQGHLADRPVLGVYYTTITKAYALSQHLSRDRGALIGAPSAGERSGIAILSGSPAEKAGLRANDIVIAINGREINLDYPLGSAIGEFSIGDTITLLIIRDGKELSLPVKL